jgi:hypothetical protein
MRQGEVALRQQEAAVQLAVLPLRVARSRKCRQTLIPACIPAVTSQTR